MTSQRPAVREVTCVPALKGAGPLRKGCVVAFMLHTYDTVLPHKQVSDAVPGPGAHRGRAPGRK